MWNPRWPRTMREKSAWRNGTKGSTTRIAEFVDSIPFTETREYVEIVTRNAGIYRKLYGAQPQNEPHQSRTRHRH